MGHSERKNWLEMIVLGISGILVIFIVGFLIYQMIFEKQTSPEIVVSYGEIENKSTYFALPVTVTNTGGETAENVHLEIIGNNDDSTGKSEIEFAYLPGKSSVKGWATFKSNPGKSIQVRVLGYTSP